MALVGGGHRTPRPGEISLADNGVVFLDELPEFDRHVLEVLPEPLESGRVTISRAAGAAEFPARSQLVAAMNPCPCGYAGDPSGRCRCTPAQIAQYRGRLSGPLLDRIDLHMEVPAMPREVLLTSSAMREPSGAVKERATAARARMLARNGSPNAALGNKEIGTACALVEQAMTKLGLSARAYHRVLKVARTIADLAGAEQIAPAHLAETI